MTLLKSIEFASLKHRDQRRKDAIKAPYINHCIRVASILEDIGGIDDQEILMAAILHDTIEDTGTTAKEIENLFGVRVLKLVEMVSDDKTLSKQMRKDLQVEHAPHVSSDVALVKFADKIANCEDLLVSAPPSWSNARIYDYFQWSNSVVERLPKINIALYEYAKEVMDKGLKRYRQEGRTIIYGDLHGCLEEFKELRAKVNPMPDDREIIIGDILDKGPYSIETLRYANEKNFECLMGNHEYRYLRFHNHQEKEQLTGKKNPMTFGEEKMGMYENLSKDDFDYISEMPFYIKINNLTLLHGGITNDIVLESAKKKKLESVVYIRHLNDEGKWTSTQGTSSNQQLWNTVYDGNQGVIVYGHSDYKEVRIDPYAIGIDTGCVYGNKLTAIVLEDTVNPMQNYKIVDVQAQEKYFELRS